LTRHDLKDQLQHDQFTDAVSNVVSYSSSHRQTIIKYSIIVGLALILAGVAVWISNYRATARQNDLQAAFSVLDIPVASDAPGTTGKTYATADEKNKAAQKAFADVVAKDSGSREGEIAQYYLGTLKAQAGDAKGAESDLNAAANGGAEVSSLAKIALAQLYLGQKKTAQAENLLRDVINKPTDLVSKPQAQILLAQMLESSNPSEAKKIVQSLRTPNQSPAVTRALEQIASQPAQ
jgi:hypothetical protein